MTAIVEAEAKAASSDGKSWELPDEDEMKRIEKEGLIRPESFDLFLTWYAFHGAEKGISLTEIMTIDAAIIADFSYILRQLADIRARNDYFQGIKPDTGRAK